MAYRLTGFDDSDAAQTILLGGDHLPIESERTQRTRRINSATPLAGYPHVSGGGFSAVRRTFRGVLPVERAQGILAGRTLATNSELGIQAVRGSDMRDLDRLQYWHESGALVGLAQDILSSRANPLSRPPALEYTRSLRDFGAHYIERLDVESGAQIMGFPLRVRWTLGLTAASQARIGWQSAGGGLIAQITTRDGIRLTDAAQLPGVAQDGQNWFGYRRSPALGAIEGAAQSRVQLAVGGRRANTHPSLILRWTGQPTSGTVYARFVLDADGAATDFALAFRTTGGATLDAATGTPTWFADAPISGVWNAAGGLPVGTLYLYSDAARTRIISMRSA